MRGFQRNLRETFQSAIIWQTLKNKGNRIKKAVSDELSETAGIPPTGVTRVLKTGIIAQPTVKTTVTTRFFDPAGGPADRTGPAGATEKDERK